MPARLLTRGAAVVAALVLAATTLATPAASLARAAAPSGTPTWGPVQALDPRLFDVLLTASPDGSTWGVGTVGVGPTSHLAVLHQPPGGGATVRGLPVVGDPLAVADDGRATFVLYAAWTGCGIPCQIRLVGVPHGGAPGPSRLLDRTDGGVPGASLLARDGQWWAAWSGAVKKVRRPQAEADFAYYVHEARTLGTSYGTRALVVGGPEVRAAQPRLVFRGRHQVLLALDRPADVEFWVAGLPAGPLQRSTRRLLTPGRHPEAPTSVATVGTSTVVAYSGAPGRGVVVAQDDADLRFHERSVPTRTPGGFPRLATSLGRVFVAYRDCVSTTDCRGYVASSTPPDGFVVADVTAPLVRPGGTDPYGVAALTAAGGKATVLLRSASPGLYLRSQR